MSYVIRNPISKLKDNKSNGLCREREVNCDLKKKKNENSETLLTKEKSHRHMEKECREKKAGTSSECVRKSSQLGPKSTHTERELQTRLKTSWKCLSFGLDLYQIQLIFHSEFLFNE